MMNRGVALLLLVLAAGVHSSLALSPPWWNAATIIRASLASDKYVSTSAVDTDSGTIQVNIAVAPCCTASGGRRLSGTAACMKSCTAATKKAQALSTLLTASAKKMTENYAQQVVVKVTQGNGVIKAGAAPTTTTAAAAMFKQAMPGCADFVKIAVQPAGLGSVAETWAVFKPKASQYWNDNISQYGSLTTKLASEVFDEAFLLESYGISATNDACNGKDCTTTRP